MKPTAIITGVTGQDGSYLAELLIGHGYRVIGIKRRSSSNDLGNAKHIKELQIEEGDVTDLPSLTSIFRVARPDHVYNLAAQSHVATSFSQPLCTFDVNTIGAVNCLEAIRNSGYHSRFYQASTSELFGGMSEAPCDESTPFRPRSPYGVSKLAAHWMTVNYRESYKMFACCGILFNHESERRGQMFVTQKIAKAVARIKLGKQKTIALGNLSAKRDWGHAKDYVLAMHKMLLVSEPRDYVIGTGETHSVDEFLHAAFQHVGIQNFTSYVTIDPTLYRPTEVNVLLANPAKAMQNLNWKPTIDFHKLVARMVDNQLQLESNTIGEAHGTE